MRRRPDLILNPIFIIGVLTLLINDHLLKDLFHNWITGKLSDFAGVLILPIFIAYLFPKTHKSACVIAAIWFIFWKSSFSERLIDLVNLNSFFQFERVVDFSDLIALSILPLAWSIIRNENRKVRNFPLGRYALVFVTCFSLCSTSVYRPLCNTPEGTIFIGHSYKLKVPKDTVLERIRSYGYDWKQIDSIPENYMIENIIIPINKKGYCGPTDTIEKLTFSFSNYYGEEKLLIKEVTFSDTLHITHWKTMKEYAKMYDKITKDLFVKEARKK